MPKIKTNSGAKKRFKLTKNGKVKRSNAYTSHLLSSKTTKRKRKLRKSSTTSVAETKRVKKMIPYAG